MRPASTWKAKQRWLRAGWSYNNHVNFLCRQREQLRTLAVQQGTIAHVFWVDVPAHEAITRWQQNRETGRRLDVRDEDFAQVVERFQSPTPDEEPLRYDGTMSVATWISSCFATTER